MTHLAPAPTQPRPVMVAFRWVVAMQMTVGPLIGLLLEFDVINWTAGQIARVNTFAGIVVAAVAYALGLRAEARVTPTSNPRLDSYTPLTADEPTI